MSPRTRLVWSLQTSCKCEILPVQRELRTPKAGVLLTNLMTKITDCRM